TDPARTPLHAGLRQDYGVQVSGGTAAVRYFLSSQLQSEDGGLRLQGAELNRLDSISGGNVRDWQVRPNGYRRGELRGNLSAALSPHLQLTLFTGFVDGLTRPTTGGVLLWQTFRPGSVQPKGAGGA